MQKFAIWMEPGKYYHVFNRACGFDKLFIDRGNYIFFLDLYSRYLEDYVDTYTYCLLPNHFHFLIKPKELNDHTHSDGIYSMQFSRLFNSYAKSFNRLYGRKGTLFSQNYKRKEITSMEYLKGVVIYIHRNPINHGYIKNIDEWNQFSYFSIIDNKTPPINIKSEDVLDWFDGKENFLICHKLDIPVELED